MLDKLRDLIYNLSSSRGRWEVRRMAKSKAEVICPNVDKQKVEETRQLAEKIATLPMQTKLVFAAAAEMAAIIHDAKGA